jgi:hypothetical protein
MKIMGNDTLWNEVSLSGYWCPHTNNALINGTVQTTTNPHNTGSGSGNFKASFFGPKAQELGGSWNMKTSVDNGHEIAVGTFSAKR